MVQRERLLEALGGQLARGEQRAGVVGEDVNVLVAPADVLGQGADLGHRRQIGYMLMNGCAAADSLRFSRYSAQALRLTTHERDLDALASQLDRRGSADAASSSSEHDERHLIDSSEIAPVRGTRLSASRWSPRDRSDSRRVAPSRASLAAC